MRARLLLFAVVSIAVLLRAQSPVHAQDAAKPGSRSVMDAHNCYPYFEWWSNRIDRALTAGTPLAIEQDLGWYTNAKTGRSWSVVTHADPPEGGEPTMEHYFFDRVRPIVEKALRDGNHSEWPIVTLNLDFKDNKPEHLAEVRALLLKHRDWITEAPKGADPAAVQTLVVRPILVLTGEADEQQVVFYDELKFGDPVLAFGAIHSADKDYHAAPEVIDSEKATNYRRWWNNAWKVVEAGGQQHAGEWTPAKTERLRALVEHAHANGLWIRFYTLDGTTEDQLSCNGWFRSYNFGSVEAARKRWDAAIAAGVDYIASDQYELLGKEVGDAKPRQ